MSIQLFLTIVVHQVLQACLEFEDENESDEDLVNFASWSCRKERKMIFKKLLRNYTDISSKEEQGNADQTKGHH